VCRAQASRHRVSKEATAALAPAAPDRLARALRRHAVVSAALLCASCCARALSLRRCSARSARAAFSMRSRLHCASLPQ
jgi:hypothetical protein